MKTKYNGLALAWLATALLLTACGGGGGSGTSGGTGIYNLSGQFQKGPFVIGSQVSVNELDENLYPTGIVYNVQTSDDLGKFSVPTKIGKHLVEIVGDGFYMDELTGQLSSTRIQLRAVADLNIHSIVTVNILTSLQSQRLKALLLQGSTYAAANSQSQNEVLAAFGIDYTKVNSLSTLYSMAIDGTTDADSVLLAVSTILSKMATNAAITNSTSQPAELSNYVNTIASQISYTGTITQAANITAKNLAATQINLAAVRANIETYYANRGVTIVAPKFEEWVDKYNLGTLPQRLVPVADLTFTDAIGVSPSQLITSNAITVTGLGTGNVAPVAVNPSTTIIKNNNVISGPYTDVQDGDIIAMRVTSLGYGLTNSSNISVGSSSATWNVTTQSLGGTISGLTGTGLIMQINGGGNINIPSGSTSFSFPTTLANGVSYNASVLIQPNMPFQDCIVSNGSGTVGSGVSNISVVCSDLTLSDIAYAYVASASSSIYNLSGYRINTITGAITNTATAPTGISVSFIAIHPTGKFAYSADMYGSDSVSAYSINTNTGALAYVASVPTGSQPLAITVHPTGKFAYVTNFNSDSVSAYSIDATTGALSSISTVAAGSHPRRIAFDPAGKFAYVLNLGYLTGFGISVYSIDAATGALTSTSTAMTAVSPEAISVHPNGKFAYVVHLDNPSSVWIYSTDVTTGALTNTAIVSLGFQTVDITIDPTGKFAYVPNLNANNISAYSIDSTTGTLSSISAVASGVYPGAVTFDPTGNFAYVTNGQSISISAYSFDSTTGTLTNIATLATDIGPMSVAIGRAP